MVEMGDHDRPRQRHRHAVFLVHEADDAAEALANGFAVQGQRPRQQAGAGLQPAGQQPGEGLQVESGQHVAVEVVAGHGVEAGTLFLAAGRGRGAGLG